MFDWLVFVGALLLAAPVIAIVALVHSIGLNSRLRSLEAKIATLERQFPATDTSRVQTTARTAATPLQTEPQAPQPVPPVTPAREAAAAVEATPAATSVPTFPRSDGTATTKKIGFEERFGTRWVVWVGGIALALGGIFLVRYSIEQGLVGPGVRIMLGGLLAAALIVAGEWQRRTERQLSFPGVRSANIPSVLTAAGTTVAYATIYAAYALYGFLPPAAAFVLLGAVALATLAAALLHGPALGGLGIIGAYLAPILVASTEPDYWSLYIYLAVVNAAAFPLARIRLWYWLALTALVLGALWSWPGTDPIYFSFVTALGAHVFYVVASFALAATFLVANLLYGPTAAPGAMDRLSNFALSIYLLAATILVLTSRHDPARSFRSSCLQR